MWHKQTPKWDVDNARLSARYLTITSPDMEQTMLMDCHTHLDSFADIEIESILGRAKQSGVGIVINAGTTIKSSSRSVDLTYKFPGIFAGVGIHPMDLRNTVDEHVYSQLKILGKSTDKVVVISEIGLDFMEGMPDRSDQYQAFRAQIRLARELSLPIVFHSRQAHEETLKVLREERAYEVGGAMHYFQSGLDIGLKAIDLGFHVSLAKPLLRLPTLQSVAKSLPMESIVLETDAAPQPFKTKRANWTEPRHILDVAAKLAELKNITLEEVEKTTTSNLLNMLGARRTVIERYLQNQQTNQCGGR